MPRLTVLAVYPSKVASTRLRAQQYFGHFRNAGIQPVLWTFFREDDMERWFQGSHFHRMLLILRGSLRLITLPKFLKTSDIIMVVREVAPIGPPLIEKWLARRVPLIWNVDDAIWEDYPSLFLPRLPRWIRKTAHKYHTICAIAEEVWAGSEVLAQWCRSLNANVKVVPTVVPVPDSLPTVKGSRTVGWLGTPSTAPFVATVLSGIAEIEPPPAITIVGAKLDPASGLNIECLPWSEETEKDVLQSLRVGIYPIDRGHPLAEGKCGLKAILYMAHGVPPVVTPTTTNSRIVRNGIDGLHAKSPEEWRDGVGRLLSSPALWEQCRRAGHKRALQEYSLQRWAPQVAKAVLNLAQGTVAPKDQR